jgi:hypothetical protein
MSINKLTLSVTLAAALGAAPMAQAFDNCTASGTRPCWTPFVSEENGSPMSFCPNWTDAARGFACTGNRCDNLRLLCDKLPFGVTLNSADDYWSGWFSEESDGVEGITSVGWYRRFDENYHVCHYAHLNPGWVSGIRCRGSNCDDVSIECTKAVKWNGSQNVYINANSCGWTSSTYSDENGSNGVDFGFNRIITGVKCEGGNCDNMRFHVCSMTNPGF